MPGDRKLDARTASQGAPIVFSLIALIARTYFFPAESRYGSWNDSHYLGASLFASYQLGLPGDVHLPFPPNGHAGRCDDAGICAMKPIHGIRDSTEVNGACVALDTFRSALINYPSG